MPFSINLSIHLSEIIGIVPPGCLSVEPIPQVTRFSVPLHRAQPWYYAAGIHTLSVRSICVCWLSFLMTPRIICLRCARLNFCLFCYIGHNLSPHIPPMGFTSCYDQRPNLLPPDERACTLTTQPIRLALAPQDRRYWCTVLIFKP